MTNATPMPVVAALPDAMPETVRSSGRNAAKGLLILDIESAFYRHQGILRNTCEPESLVVQAELLRTKVIEMIEKGISS